MTAIANSRSALRQQLRQRRRQLSQPQQRRAAELLCKRLKSQPLFIRSRHIALYLANDGEIDPSPLIKAAWKLGKRCYLPVLQPGQENRLWFIRYEAGTPLIKNRYGIAQPRAQYRQSFPAKQLDLVLMPLVGFDNNGGRMGMGGGFYDRTFSFKNPTTAQRLANNRRRSCPPYLLGLAHECQQVEQLTLASWDIPLSAIATDKRLIVSESTDAQRNFIHR
jgi:5-formyltetrahydrofolate cyclo-ligase